ncbi:acyltransferase family protein [Rhizobium panacihumi]|uniref:acyltransferase family protein n=1 Tax=Rhizobium panacihumi TaxID=2008450 RepID=UPI003D7B7A2E
MVANTDRLDRLDDLRFFACFMVLIFHMPYSPAIGEIKLLFSQLVFFKEGHSGVAFFCTISGFIFAHLYYDRDIRYGEFIKRRVMRIVPLFVFVALLGLALDGTWTADRVLAALTTIHTGPFVGFAAPAWSVLVEFQFYLLFPFIVLFTKRYGWSYLVFLIVMFIGLRWTIWLGHGKVRDLSYFTLYGRADQFLAGMLTAFSVKHITKKEFSPLLAWLIFAIGAVIVTLALMKLYQKGGFIGTEKKQIWIFLPTLEAIGYSLIISGYVLGAKATQRGRVGSLISYLGRISYSTYLIHAFVMYAMRDILYMAPTWEMAIIYFLVMVYPAVVLTSIAVYNLIEKPFLELRPPRPENTIKALPVTEEAALANPPVPFKLRS